MAAAYGALVSVMQIIRQLQHHPFPPISLDKEQAESLTGVVSSLQEFLQGYNSPFADGDEADPLEMRIADAAYAAEDVIESNIVHRILPPAPESQGKKMGFFSSCFPSPEEPKNDGENCFPSPAEPKNDGENINSLDLYEGLQKVIEDMVAIKKETAEIVAEKAVVVNQLQRKVDSATAGASVSSSAGQTSTSTMVGFDDAQLEIMDKLTSGGPDRQVIPIVGMGGIGKTTLVKNIYAQPFIKGRFDICIWVTISQQYTTRGILCDLLSQATKIEKEELSGSSEDKLGTELHKYLFGRRFLIVMDDVWSIDAWEKVQLFFPDNDNGSRVLVTTRLSNLGSQLNNNYSLQMKFLDEYSSWDLFSKTVFRGGGYPFELHEIAMEIVRNCKGLPLTIVVVGGLLEKLELTKESWQSISRNLNSIVNSDEDDYCLKILKMSYNHLPIHLKPCFLYIGVFEEDRAIRVSTVIRLWVSEGIVKPISNQSLETTAKEYLDELVDRNLIQVFGLGSTEDVLLDRYLFGLGSTGDVKYCKIHDLLRDLCLREAQKERFYHVLGQHGPHATCSQRRIVIPISASKKEVLEALESMPRIRSYISEKAVVPSLPNLRFLRILKTYESDAYSGYMHDLRNMFELVNIRYLVVGAHRHLKLPSSINLMWNLHTLIVAHPKKVDAPVEIWKMPQLRHVHFRGGGSYLPNPPNDDTNTVVIMENLHTLKGVWNFRCDEEVVRRIPNIKKLGLKYDKGKGPECLPKLKSLSYYMEKLSFPLSLTKLSLKMSATTKLEEMLEKIGSLPLLQKLRLTYGQFTTREWATVEGQFRSLKFLSLKSCRNLERWMMERSHFPCLERLHLCDASQLEEIPTEIGEIPTLQSIVLKYCRTSAVKSLKRIVEEQEELQGGADQLSFKVEVVHLGKNQELLDLETHNFQVTTHLTRTECLLYFCSILLHIVSICCTAFELNC